MNRLLLPLLLLLLPATACQAPRGGLSWTGANAPESQPPPPRTPAPKAPALDLLDRTPRPDPASLPPMLTGRNKPNGPAMRFRQAVPPETPAFVPRTLDGLDLFIADALEEGWLAFYKGRCGSLGAVCAYRAVLLADDGTQRWNLNLNRFLQGTRYVEIQDVRYHAGRLYFNEACATYAGEVQGQCSWLVCLDPDAEEVAWRTPPLTSNNIFILHDGAVLAGYGFTAEPDALYRIDARTGKITARADLDSAPQYLEVLDGRLFVVTYQSLYTFAL